MDQVFTYNYSLDKILKEHDDFIDPTFIIECPPTPKLEYDIEDNFYHQQTFIIDDQYQFLQQQQQQHIINDKAILVVDNQLKQIQEKEKKEKEINQNQSIKVDEFEFFIRKSFQYLGNKYSKNTNEAINSSSYPLAVTSDRLPINKIKKRIYIKRKCTIIAIHKIQSLEFIIKKKKKNLPSPQKKKLLIN
ncbi:hypothetical protein ACTFIW_003471 [Dictyostelium discoideum]